MENQMTDTSVDDSPVGVKKQKVDEKTVVVCPIVYGSIANLITGRKVDESATHRWTLYVRGPNDEDLSTFVEDVVFTLHPSFQNPIKTVSSPPFEVTEVGWGEFEAGIRIVFKSVNKDEKNAELNFKVSKADPVGANVTTALSTSASAANLPAAPVMRSASSVNLQNNVESAPAPTTGSDDAALSLENAVEMVHVIRLYHPIEDVVSASLKKPVVAEVYDEVVVPNPSPYLLYNCQLYGESRHAAVPNARPYTVTRDLYEPFPSEMENLEHLTIVYNFVKEELEKAKKELLYKDVLITQLKYASESASSGGAGSTAAAAAAAAAAATGSGSGSATSSSVAL